MTKTEMARLLDNYATAVATQKYWEDHGTHGDRRLETARKDARATRRELETAIQNLSA
jgi:hypothetical protein